MINSAIKRTFLYTGTCYASWSLHIYQCLHWYLQTNMAHGWSIVLFVLNIAADYYLSSIIGLDPVKKKTQCLRWTHGWDIGWSWQLCLYQVHILVLTVHFIVMLNAYVTEVILDKWRVVPYYSLSKTIFICWCLLPGPFSGTDFIFFQVGFNLFL